MTAIKTLYRWAHNLILFRPIAWTLIFINLVGTVLGFVYWYGVQIRATPLLFVPFVPDSPLSTLFFPISLLLIMAGRRYPRFFAFAAFGLIKYGLWTVWAWIVFWTHGGGPTIESIAMTITHLGMAGEGLFLLSYAGLDVAGALLIGGWFLLNDWVDYGLGYHPRVLPQMPVSWMGAEGFLSTIVLSALYLSRARGVAQRVLPWAGPDDLEQE
ncbi:MAG: DUF1405 domain-containing protein [Chloroflexi bacterium]|nr:DUF1405 domain-containing protein [Chloroflexota bacterium]